MSEVLRAEIKKHNVKMIIVNPGDAPTDTPLTSGQETHYQNMEDNMTQEETLIHGDLFNRCRKYYTRLFPVPNLKMIDNQSYYFMMETILKSHDPKAYYCNSDTITTIIFTIVKYLPRKVSDVMRLKMLKCYEEK